MTGSRVAVIAVTALSRFPQAEVFYLCHSGGTTELAAGAPLKADGVTSSFAIATDFLLDFTWNIQRVHLRLTEWKSEEEEEE